MSAQAVPGIPLPVPAKVFISGASGVDSFFKGVAKTAVGYVKQVPVAGVCPASNGTVFIHDGTNSYGYYGISTNNATGVTAGQPLLILKRSAGGSANGVGPLATSTAIAVSDWTAAGTLDSGTCNEYTVTTTNVVPDIGVSDVEPKMFTNLNQEFGVAPLSTSQLASLTVAPWAQLAEGIVATKAVPGNYLLTENFVREAMDGHYQDWSVADPAHTDASPMVLCRRIQGSGTQAAYNSHLFGFPNTSAYNGYGLTIPAVTGDSFGLTVPAAIPVVPATTPPTFIAAGDKQNPILIDPSAGFTVFEGDGSGEVRKCMQAAQLGVDTIPLKGRDTLFYVLQFSKVVGGPSKALGVLSLDSYTAVSTATSREANVFGVDGNGYGADNTYVANTYDGLITSTTPGAPVVGNGEWTFRFLNGNGVYDVKGQTDTTALENGTFVSSGIAPSRTNLLNNSYDFTVEPTVQKRTAGNTALVNSFYTYLTNKLGAPADMVDLPTNTNNTAPLAYVAIPTATNVKGSTSPTNLIADLTRQGVTPAPLHVRQ
jgi:hypothetical protein